MGFRYIGSKIRIADSIMEYLGMPDANSGCFVDAFSGTGAVASSAADRGWSVKVNDMLLAATTIAVSRLVSASEVTFHRIGGYETACEILNDASENQGFFWREYSPASQQFCGIERRYFTEENARRIDGARARIAKWYTEKSITGKERTVLNATVINAMNSVANIAGTYGCFISHWTAQAKTSLTVLPLALRESVVDYTVSNCDVMQLVTKENDLVYLDPPYTKRQYASYYHIIETFVRGDDPVVEGVAGLRPWKDKASIFCYKTKALAALVELIRSLHANRVLLSYSDEGHVELSSLIGKLSAFGTADIVQLGEIGRYRPNRTAVAGRSNVIEYLVDFRRNGRCQ